LVGAYALAAVYPAFGSWIRGISLGEITLCQQKTRITLPVLMLAILLLNAGLGVQTSQLQNLLRSPLALAAGLVANLLIPVTFIFAVSRGMRFWHNPDEIQNILVGLALVAAMPIAGSSTAWAQNAGGDLALSLGLVLSSTLLSPLTMPLTFDLVEHMADGEYAQALKDLITKGGGVFLLVCVRPRITPRKSQSGSATTASGDLRRTREDERLAG
jgi:bile acid:Na+ symporter, BASS family